MLVVQKFGGSSVADAERVMRVAGIITDTYKQGNDVVVVVSAQGDTTDDLIEKARELNPRASKREMDMLLTVGEQISVSLMAMQLEKLRLPVVSLTGWQAGLQTDETYGNARVLGLVGRRIEEGLEQGKIVVVTGFQGVNDRGDITTLGRGGSDTTAVALAAFLKADLCQIYTDVDGVYDKDPRKHPDAVKYERIGYDAMLELARQDGLALAGRLTDCGTLIFDQEKQDVHSGGSGCGCSAVTLCGYLLSKVQNGKYRRILFCGTGALLSPTSTQQGLPIPGVCHAVCIHGREA